MRRDVSPVNYISPVSSRFSKLCGSVVTIDAHKMMCQGLKRAKPCHHIPFQDQSSRYVGVLSLRVVDMVYRKVAPSKSPPCNFS